MESKTLDERGRGAGRMSFSNLLSRTRSVLRRKKAAAGPSRDVRTEAENSPVEVSNGSSSGHDDASQENESVGTPVFPVDGSILSARSARGKEAHALVMSFLGVELCWTQA
uniref:Uncharacterized protein n=1 Tax=Rhodosorus marinus TaxID=101924 RepID=A0A7S3EKA6_9RHOD|mmetsp:Transcript_40360/g.160283  ORF Transcript_40360/g.160283 Transcript_40360/m.160283 type:complete len:111 (+) Transcript_40360:72-404(+)